MMNELAQALDRFAVVALGGTILAKATAILALTALLAYLARSFSAAARCALWSAALCVLAALPFLSVVVPAWEVSLPAWHGAAALDGPGPAGRARAGVAEDGPFVAGAEPAAGLSRDGTSASAPGAGLGGARGTVPAAGSRVPPGSSRGRDLLAAALLLIWLGGATILLARLVLHAARISEVTRRASPVRDGPIAAVAAGVMRDLRLPSALQIAISREVSLPLSWGVGRHVILLPFAAQEWTTLRSRSVLLHELAHVGRSDYVLHLVVEIVRAIYWPNPFVWLAARRHAAERERACDDFVLGQGTSARDYASELIQIARAQLQQPVPVGAVAMARRSSLRERINCLLNDRVNRAPLRPGTMFLALFLALAVAVPTAALMSGSDKARIPSTTDLVTVLRDAEDALARRTAAWWLGEHEARRAVEPLEDALLGDSDANVRLVSAWALGEIKDEESIPDLMRALDDRDPFVREMAVLSLGEIENPSVVDVLLRVSQSEPELRGAVIWALGEIGDEEAQSARRVVFADWERRSWDNEEVWIGEMDDREVKKAWRRRGRGSPARDVPELVSLLSDTDPEKRREAALTLGLFGIQDRLDSAWAVDGLLDALRDPEPEVRAMAIWALDEINPSRSRHFR